MSQLYAVRWINPDREFSGAMHNVRAAHLEETIDRAWLSAGPNGQVEFEGESHEVVEYAF